MRSNDGLMPDTATQKAIDTVAAYINHMQTYFRPNGLVQDALRTSNRLLQHLRKIDLDAKLADPTIVYHCYERLCDLNPRVAELFRDENGLQIGRMAVQKLGYTSGLWKGTTDHHG